MHWEFFKRLGNLNEEEVEKLATHLPNQIHDREEKRPKVVVHKFKENLPQLYATKDKVEHRKKEKIVIKNYMNWNQSLVSMMWTEI